MPVGSHPSINNHQSLFYSLQCLSCSWCKTWLWSNLFIELGIWMSRFFTFTTSTLWWLDRSARNAFSPLYNITGIAMYIHVCVHKNSHGGQWNYESSSWEISNSQWRWQRWFYCDFYLYATRKLQYGVFSIPDDSGIIMHIRNTSKLHFAAVIVVVLVHQEAWDDLESHEDLCNKISLQFWVLIYANWWSQDTDSGSQISEEEVNQCKELALHEYMNLYGLIERVAKLLTVLLYHLLRRMSRWPCTTRST